MMVERVSARGGANAGLAHRAAQPLLPAPDLVDEIARPRDGGADGCAQSLGEVDPGGVPSCHHFARAEARCNAVVQQPRPIHVGGETMASCDLHDLIESGFLPDGAAADIGGLFDTDQCMRRLIAAARMQRLAEGVRRKLPVVARQRRDLKSAQRGMGAALTSDDMGALMRYDLVA